MTIQSKDPIRLHVVLAFHQPIHTDDTFLAQACANCYQPILTVLKNNPAIKISLHITGHLLDYLTRNQEVMLLQLRELVKLNQVEILGGVFYGGLLSLLPEADIRSQIQMSAEFWESLIGHAPAGFWLPECAWAIELPRLFAQTQLHYGFVSNSQLHPEDARAGLGRFERGEDHINAWVIDSELCSMLPEQAIDTWVKAATTHGSQQKLRLVNVWLRAESLGLEPGTSGLAAADGWFDNWLKALAEHSLLTYQLPRETFLQVQPQHTLRLQKPCAPEVWALGADAAALHDWQDFTSQFVEINTLHRRMLQTSKSLREAVFIMQDEGLEQSWSDKLATAQRLVFAAQAPDAYWRTLAAGFSNPQVRDATMSRLIRAESLIRSLVQLEPTWVSIQETDLSGDGLTDIFVATPSLQVWLTPTQCGQIRSLESLTSLHNILDVGTRRLEPFIEQAEQAPYQPPKKPLARHLALPRLVDDLPTHSDAQARAGMRPWVVECNTSPKSLMQGSATNLLPEHQKWQYTRSTTGNENSPGYSHQLKSDVILPGPTERRLQVRQNLHIPAAAAQLHMTWSITLHGSPKVLWGLEIPVRPSHEPIQLWVNKQEISGKQYQVPDASHILVTGGGHETIELTLQTPCELWLLPVRTCVRDVMGYSSIAQGFIIMPVLYVEHRASMHVEISLNQA